MLDFSPVRRKELTMAELVQALTPADLRRLTDEMVDGMLGLIAEAVDADVVFVPLDPDAHDSAASEAEAVDLAWTLGHVVVHATASSEEAAWLAAELARGVPLPDKRRSRYEVPWETVTTIAQCRARLEESRRMRLATLDVWPDAPHLDNAYQLWDNGPRASAVERFVRGLAHDDSHLGQIKDIVAQAKAARAPVTNV
ncbi:MAG: DinB family protein [Anaerolineales bacterium]|nr:DinB family protein [Anaerolineales bacterium]